KPIVSFGDQRNVLRRRLWDQFVRTLDPYQRQHFYRRGRKRPGIPGQVTGKKRTAREPLMKCRKYLDDVQNRVVIVAAGQAPTIPVYGRSGIRHERWPELAMRRLNGTWDPELRC